MVLACCELFKLRFHFGSSNLRVILWLQLAPNSRPDSRPNYIHAEAEEDRRRAAKDTGGNLRVDTRECCKSEDAGTLGPTSHAEATRERGGKTLLQFLKP